MKLCGLQSTDGTQRSALRTNRYRKTEYPERILGLLVISTSYCAIATKSVLLLVAKEVLHFCVVNHFFFEDERTCFGRALHLYAFGLCTTFTLLQGCHCFLCHLLFSLLDFTMHCNALQNRIVFPTLQTIWSILSVLGGDVARRAWHTRRLVLGTLKNYLHTRFLRLLCHLIPLLPAPTLVFQQKACFLCLQQGSLQTILFNFSYSSR